MISRTETVKVSVNNTPAGISAEPRPRRLRVYANRRIHVAAEPDASASTSSMPIAAETPQFIDLGAGSSLSIVIADGEVSGDAWITEV